MLASNPSRSPYNSSLQLHSDTSQPYLDTTQYRRFIWQFIYLTTTRPNISFDVQQVSQFVSYPTITDYQAALRILQYLKASPTLGLLYLAKTDLSLSDSVDSDWATYPTTRRSMTLRKISNLLEVKETNHHFPLKFWSWVSHPFQSHLRSAMTAMLVQRSPRWFSKPTSL